MTKPARPAADPCDCNHRGRRSDCRAGDDCRSYSYARALAASSRAQWVASRIIIAAGLASGLAMLALAVRRVLPLVMR